MPRFIWQCDSGQSPCPATMMHTWKHLHMQFQSNNIHTTSNILHGNCVRHVHKHTSINANLGPSAVIQHFTVTSRGSASYTLTLQWCGKHCDIYCRLKMHFSTTSNLITHFNFEGHFTPKLHRHLLSCYMCVWINVHFMLLVGSYCYTSCVLHTVTWPTIWHVYTISFIYVYWP